MIEMWKLKKLRKNKLRGYIPPNVQFLRSRSFRVNYTTLTSDIPLNLIHNSDMWVEISEFIDYTRSEIYKLKRSAGNNKLFMLDLLNMVFF
jgi:hypothetical protein